MKTSKLMIAPLILSALATALAFSGCGDPKDKQGEVASVTDPNADLLKLRARPSVALEPVNCAEKKSSPALLTSLTQDLFGRPPTSTEMKLATDPTYDTEKLVDWALDHEDVKYGISLFVTNLLSLNNLVLDPDEEDQEVIQLFGDLKQEPVQWVLSSWKDRPWGDFFTSRKILCTSRTAKLYDYPVFDVAGFVPCEMQEERAGFLGMVSVLRAIPSSFYSANNNYKRVAFSLYLSQGVKLAAATNGPAGDGPGLPLAACVPATDMRKADSGLVFGTASVPLQGSTCASCHATHNGPLSIAFRRFDMDGRLLGIDDIDRLRNEDTLGVSRDTLKLILAESNSCWSNAPETPPQKFNGVPGLGRLIASSPLLGRALGVQIGHNLLNTEPDGNMITSAQKGFEENGMTLKAALKGFFTSNSYQCARKK